MFNYAVENVQHNLHQANEWMHGAATSVGNKITSEMEKAKKYVIDTGQQVKQSCIETAQKTKEFVLRNKETIFFVACVCVTAYFSPYLFFPVLVATIILRVELTFYLKKLANEYLKPEKNMYLLNPRFGPNYVSTLDVTMAAIAAVDAIALGTIFVAGSWTVTLIPALAGITAGSCAARLGMDIAQMADQPLV